MRPPLHLARDPLAPVPDRPLTTTEALRLLDERVRAINVFIETHGIDFWYRDAGDQLELADEQAA